MLLDRLNVFSEKGETDGIRKEKTMRARYCTNCDRKLVKSSETRHVSAEPENEDLDLVTSPVVTFVCPGCGLIHSFALEHNKFRQKI